MMTDPIAAMLTTIRNANQLRYDSVTVPSSKVKVEIAKILLEEGFIIDYKVIGDKKKDLTLTLKYAANKERVISGLKRISKPGQRMYANYRSIPRVLGGLGIVILSTSAGLMTDRVARSKKLGGEMLCQIY